MATAVAKGSNPTVIAKPKIELPASQSARGMYGTYKDYLLNSEAQMNFTILEGLYQKTVMFRIVEKLTGDILSGPYTIETGNDTGDEIIKTMMKSWSIEEQKNSMRDTFVYGNSFDQIGWAVDDKNVVDICEMSVNYTTPKIDNDNRLEGYEYVDSSTFLEPRDVLHLTHCRPKAELYGMSLLMPAASVLNLLLNSNMNVAILIDRYAVPIIHWMLDAGMEGPGGKAKKVTGEQILEFLQSLRKMKSGEDLATDKSVEAKVLGLESSVWDFDQAVEFLNEQFHAICGVPAMLLGYGGTNKEISTRQMKMYYDTIKGLQLDRGQQLLSNLVEPVLLANGITDYDLAVHYPLLEIEERSERVVWAKEMYAVGAITLGEYRVIMNLPHDKPEETQTQTVPLGAAQASMNSVMPTAGG